MCDTSLNKLTVLAGLWGPRKRALDADGPVFANFGVLDAIRTGPLHTNIWRNASLRGARIAR